MEITKHRPVKANSMLQITEIDHTLDSPISSLCVGLFCFVFFCLFSPVFQDLLLSCLHKQSISI